NCKATNPSISTPIVRLDKRQMGLDRKDKLGFPEQRPWVAFLGCADARVPSEMLFGQGFNDLFGVRVAGNVLSDESSASLIYALTHFCKPLQGLPALQLVVVLGHRGCGAVKAVVEHYQGFKGTVSIEEAAKRLGNSPVENLMRRIYPSFAVAAASFPKPEDPAVLEDLLDHTILTNAKLTAKRIAGIVKRESKGPPEHPEIARVRVAYGVYDPLTFTVTKKLFTQIAPDDIARLRKDSTRDFKDLAILPKDFEFDPKDFAIGPEDCVSLPGDATSPGAGRGLLPPTSLGLVPE
ncbi:MAG: hypothetical protein Q9211_007192, partial [Gyalolechia sp. 1 TL-2023]